MATEAKNRPQRVPVSQRRTLVAEQREGFKRRYVNEEPGKVEAYLAGGWTVVCHGDDANTPKRMQDGTALGSEVRVVVNKSASASAKTAVLMEIPLELFEEDQLAKEAKIKEIEKMYDPKGLSSDGITYGSIKKTHS